MSLLQTKSQADTANCSWQFNHPSPLGWIVATWKSGKLVRLTIEEKRNKPGRDENSAGDTDAKLARQLGEHLENFFAGSKRTFPWKHFDLEGRTDFQLAVLRCCYEIPTGETMSYGQVASAVGRPGAARAVGTVMAQNTIPLLIPCHRVVASGGGIGGYSARGGVSVKEWLLARESGAVAW